MLEINLQLLLYMLWLRRSWFFVNSSWWGAVFWVCDVLTTQGCFSYGWTVLVQSQCLFWSSPHLPESRLGLHRELEGDTAETADPCRPKGHLIPCGLMLHNKSWGKYKRGGFRFTLFIIVSYLLLLDTYLSLNTYF